MILWPNEISVMRNEARDLLFPMSGVFEKVEYLQKIKPPGLGEIIEVQLQFPRKRSIFFIQACTGNTYNSHLVVNALLKIREHSQSKGRTALSLISPSFENRVCFHLLDRICEILFKDQGTVWSVSWNTPAHMENPTLAKPNQACFECGRPGHSAWDCVIKIQRPSGIKICYFCGRAGHISQTCGERTGKSTNPNGRRGKPWRSSTKPPQ